MIRIGVLAVQGDVEENVLAAGMAVSDQDADVDITIAKTPEQIAELDGLIIPGGESTAMGKLSMSNDSMKAIRDRIDAGVPVLGICAGMIMLSRSASDRIVGDMDQPLLDVLDIGIERNSFGRQRQSFETDISMDSIGICGFNGVFIRAPSVSRVGSGVEVLSRLGDRIVAVRRGDIIGTAFHPELSGDDSLHRYFVDLVRSRAAD